MDSFTFYNCIDSFTYDNCIDSFTFYNCIDSFTFYNCIDSFTYDKLQAIYIEMQSENSKLDWLSETYIPESLSSDHYWQLSYYSRLHYDA